MVKNAKNSGYNLHSSEGMETRRRTGDALGESEAFFAFQEQLSKVAEVERPVLIVGERGSGKELAAERLHYSRSDGAKAMLN